MAQAVIFDVDGTLVDSVDLHARAWQEALAKFGHEVSFERVREQIGKGGDQLMPVFVPEAELARIGEELEAFRSDLFKREYLPKVRGFPKSRELFERLVRDGKRVVLASSAKGDELTTYKRVAGIEDLVQAQTSKDEVERSKPHPDIFEEALRQLEGIPPNQCVVVGDSPYDAIAARGAHLRSVGLLCGGFPEDALWRAGFVAVYRDPSGLLAAYEAFGDAIFEAGIARVAAEGDNVHP